MLLLVERCSDALGYLSSILALIISTSDRASRNDAFIRIEFFILLTQAEYNITLSPG